jgi:hypothetical protein
MSKVLTTTAAIVIMLGTAASAPAQARGNFDRDSHPWSHPNNSVLVNYHSGYAGPVYDAHPVRDKCGSRPVAACAAHPR